MKNLKKYFVMSLIMSVMLLSLLMSSVKASAGTLLTLQPQASPTGTITPTPTPIPTTTISATPTPAPTNTGDLPKTGENDIYIVSALGAIVLIIGGVAYIKSRKYDM